LKNGSLKIESVQKYQITGICLQTVFKHLKLIYFLFCYFVILFIILHTCAQWVLNYSTYIGS
jgi:hypothetical protein